jgi:hypothetical protein
MGNLSRNRSLMALKELMAQMVLALTVLTEITLTVLTVSALTALMASTAMLMRILGWLLIENQIDVTEMV